MEHRDTGRRARGDEPRAPGPCAAALDGAPVPGDPRTSETDRLLRHVAERLRSSGADLPDARLLQLAEELLADVARVVLAWAEEPSPGIARRPAA